MSKYTYTFDQLNSNEEGDKARFLNYELTLKHCGKVDPDNYHTVDNGIIYADTPLQACELLYSIYNFDPPAGYHGRSMSVSDIVNLWNNELEPAVKTSWFCDMVGFIAIDSAGKRVSA